MVASPVFLESSLTGDAIYVYKEMYSLKFNLVSGEVSPGGVLAPVLAPFGLDLLQISREINVKTLSLYLKGVAVSVKIFVFENKQIKIVVLGPTVAFLVNSLGLRRDSELELNFLKLFNIVLLISSERGLRVEQAASIVFGTLSSFMDKFSFPV